MSDELEYLEVEVKGVGSSYPSYIVFLQHHDRELQIVIGPCEARAIVQRRQEGFEPSRPLTHDLALNLWRQLGAQVSELRIDDLFEEVYYAKLVFERDDQLIEVDCRPSDGIAMALAAGAPIFVAERVFDEAERRSGGEPDEA